MGILAGVGECAEHIASHIAAADAERQSGAMWVQRYASRFDINHLAPVVSRRRLSIRQLAVSVLTEASPRKGKPHAHRHRQRRPPLLQAHRRRRPVPRPGPRLLGQPSRLVPGAPPLPAERFRVLAYDRRGHSQSERPPGQGSIDEDAADLAALIEHLDLAPAHVAGSSFGGSIVLRLAARRPDLFRSLTVHEPPLLALPIHRPDLQPALQEANAGTAAVRSPWSPATPKPEPAASWRPSPSPWRLGPPAARTPPPLIDNAPTFLDELRDPDAFTVDLAALATFPHPALLTHGDQSPPFYPPIVAKLATVLPRAETRVFAGAGHLPMVTHPAEYAAAVMAHADAADAELGTNVPPPDHLERPVGAASAAPA